MTLFSILAAALITLYTPKDYSSLVNMQGFTPELIQIHLKLYEGYVKNAALVEQEIMKTDMSSPVYGALKRRYNWEYDGMRLHELYFDNLGGSGQMNEKSPLIAAIVKEFGSFQKWKDAFVATGMMRGIGWAVLYREPKEGRLLNIWVEEHDLGHLAGGKPLLVMDVFEHAFMPQFGLDRASYIQAFFQNVRWDEVEKRY